MSFVDEMSYAAFRAAFVVTLDCMLREALNREHAAGGGGFMDVYPVLQGTAPQIQLECLLQTWDRLHQSEIDLSPLDNCVVHAAWETLATMGKLITSPSLSRIWKGPKPMVTNCDHWVTSKMRALQLTTEEKTSSNLVRLEDELDDHCPTSAPFSGFGTQGSAVDLISIVGRWTASGAVVLGSKGLLTDDEQDILRIFFEEQSGLLR